MRSSALNVGSYGVVVNGDDVTATGLFVEHFQEYNTIWNGERGRDSSCGVVGPTCTTRTTPTS